MALIPIVCCAVDGCIYDYYVADQVLYCSLNLSFGARQMAPITRNVLHKLISNEIFPSDLFIYSMLQFVLRFWACDTYTPPSRFMCVRVNFLLTMAQRSSCTMPWHPQNNTRIQIFVFKPFNWMEMNCLNKPSINYFIFQMINTNKQTQSTFNEKIWKNLVKNSTKSLRPHLILSVSCACS